MTSTHQKIAFLFPGQGAVPETPLTDFLGTSVATAYDTFAVLETPPLSTFHQATIQSDETAQLGVFNLTLALADEACNHCTPDIVTGYSSGLYAAMVTSRCLTHTQGSQAVKLAYRGVERCNKDMIMVGVIGLCYSEVAKILHQLPTSGELSLVNNKSQVIVSISKNELILFKANCLEAGALKLIPLPFVYPYHVPELAQTSMELEEYFTSLNLPPLQIPMVAGSSPEYVDTDSTRIASLVATQLHQTVWWYKTIQCLMDNGADTFVVFDPTETLTRIIRWISRQINTIGISTMNDFSQLQDL